MAAPRRRHPGRESGDAGAVAARQVRMRLVRRLSGGVSPLVGARCAFPAFDSSTMIRLRARHRGQYVIASQEALGATVSPQRGHRRTDRSPRAPDARRSFTSASRIAAAFLSPSGRSANGVHPPLSCLRPSDAGRVRAKLSDAPAPSPARNSGSGRFSGPHAPSQLLLALHGFSPRLCPEAPVVGRVLMSARDLRRAAVTNVRKR
jgi:hypothetical protein